MAEEGLEYDDCDEECVQVYRIKMVFAVVCFLEAYIVGLLPTWIPSCRTSPKIFGVANAFSAGIFMAIAFLAMLRVT